MTFDNSQTALVVLRGDKAAFISFSGSHLGEYSSVQSALKMVLDKINMPLYFDADMYDPVERVLAQAMLEIGAEECRTEAWHDRFHRFTLRCSPADPR